MMYRKYKALPWIGTTLTLAGALALSACSSKDNEATPAAAPSTSVADTATSSEDAAASETSAADDMHSRMERDQRQKMDHDSMRMGPGMNQPAAPSPSAQPASQNSAMPSGGMQDM